MLLGLLSDLVPDCRPLMFLNTYTVVHGMTICSDNATSCLRTELAAFLNGNIILTGAFLSLFICWILNLVKLLQ